MLLTPWQNTVAADTHRFRVLNCGRQAGKTTLAVEEIKGVALFKPDAKIVYIATTIQQARDIVWEPLKKALLPIIKKANESRLELIVKNTKGSTSQIFLKGWEAIETLRGQQFDFIVLDEVASMRGFEEGWDKVLAATLNFRHGSALLISTPKGFNHFYDLFNRQSKDKDYKSFHFTTYDNPHMDKAEIERERASKDENTFAQEYLADFRKATGLVYKEFDRVRNTYSDDNLVPMVSEKLAGVDFGYTNPACILTILKDRDDTYWVSDEYYKTGKTDQEIAEIVSGLNFNKAYPDPESPNAVELMRRLKIPVRDVVKGKDSIKNGIATVQELMKTGKLKIHTRCENLIWEMENYSYPEKMEGKNEYENPIKEDDHAVDALRYALMMNTNAKAGRAHQYIPTRHSYVNNSVPKGPSSTNSAQQFFPKRRSMVK